MKPDCGPETLSTWPSPTITGRGDLQPRRDIAQDREDSRHAGEPGNTNQAIAAPVAAECCSIWSCTELAALAGREVFEPQISLGLSSCHSKRRASCSGLRGEPASFSSARKPGGRVLHTSETSVPPDTSSNVAMGVGGRAAVYLARPTGVGFLSPTALPPSATPRRTACSAMVNRARDVGQPARQALPRGTEVTAIGPEGKSKPIRHDLLLETGLAISQLAMAPSLRARSGQYRRCWKSVALAIQAADHGRLRENARLAADRDTRTACP